MKFRKKIFPVIFLLLFLSNGTLLSQVYFNNRYSYFGFGGDALSILETDSGYLAVGDAYNSSLTPKVSLIKIDFSGNLLWKKQWAKPWHWYYGGYPNTLIQTADSGFASVTTVMDSSNNSDIIFFRYNQQGDTLWTKQIGTGFFDSGAQCKQTSDGGFVIVGTKGMTSTNINTTLIKMDSAGNIQWQKNYGGGSDEYGFSVELTPDGGYIIGTYTKSYGSGDFDTYIIKTDNLGNQQWQKVLGGPFFDAPAVVKNTLDGNYIVACAKTINLVNGYDQAKVRVLKLDPAGNILWDKLYGAARLGTESHNIYELSDGTFIIGGINTDPTNSTPIGNGFAQGFIMKISAIGDSIWYRNYKKLTGGYSENSISDFKITSDGGIIASGSAYPAAPDTGTFDAWIFKLDGCGCEFLYCDTTCSLTGINNQQETNSNVLVYPNPSGGIFNIESSKEISRIEIYNTLGEIIYESEAKNHHFQINLSTQPQGIYFYKIISENEISSGKLVIE